MSCWGAKCWKKKDFTSRPMSSTKPYTLPCNLQWKEDMMEYICHVYHQCTMSSGSYATKCVFWDPWRAQIKALRARKIHSTFVHQLSFAAALLTSTKNFRRQKSIKVFMKDWPLQTWKEPWIKLNSKWNFSKAGWEPLTTYETLS